MWGKGYKGYAPPLAEPPAPSPQVVWITLSQESQITSEGFPAEAPALLYDKAAPVFSYAHDILSELVGDISTEVQIVHDPDWEQFPEVAAAVKEAGGEENCLGVATCPSQGKWAVGLANGWQGRERALKVSMALALAAGSDQMEKLVRQYPEFGALCADAGLVPAPRPRWTGRKGPMAGGKGWGAYGTADIYGPPCWPQEQEAHAPPLGAGTGSSSLITWLTLDEPSKLLAEGGLPSDGPAVSHDKSHADIFRSAHYILGELVGDISSMVHFSHDPDWVEFPEVGRALKAAGAEENCYCIASCPSSGKWAVGLAGGWKNRESACKLALSVAIAVNTEALDGICAKYPEFGGFCASAGLASPEAPRKKRKVQEAVPFGWHGSLGKDISGVSLGAQTTPLAKDSPLWIQLPAEQPLPEILQGLSRESLAVGTDGITRKDLYNSADAVIAHLVAEPEANIQYFDDPNWEQFPEVGESLKAHGDAEDPKGSGPRSIEEQLTIAICNSSGVWAVGFGSKWKCRNQAAKVALAATLTLRAAEMGQVPDLSTFPDFAEFVGEVQPQA